jgi:hypothetical protein
VSGDRLVGAYLFEPIEIPDIETSTGSPWGSQHDEAATIYERYGVKNVRSVEPAAATSSVELTEKSGILFVNPIP